MNPYGALKNYRKGFDRNVYLVLVAVVIGVCAGGGNILFRSAISFFQNLCYGTGGEILLPHLEAAPIWKIVFLPTFGGLLVGVIYHFYKAPGIGVPMVIKALVMKTAIPPISGFFTLLTSAITLGTGGSAGREAPIVQIGAAIGSAVGKVFRFSSNRMRFAIASGAGGGLAATFNTPMAGAMFTAEVLIGRLEFQVFAPVVISCVSATVVSRAYFGNHVTFLAPDYVFTSPVELLIYAVLGITAGIIAALFIKFYFHVNAFFNKLAAPTWLKPAIGGLLVGLIALSCRNIMGVGYGTIISILDESLISWFLLALVGMKILATSITLGSGGSGGLFVPSLFVGAALGGLIGWIAHMYFPEYVSSPASYALVGMGAVLASTIHAPLTAILMIFEISQSYQVVLPLMVAVIIGNIVSSHFENDSFFTRPLAMQGLNIQHGAEAALLGQIKVRDVMVSDIVVFREDAPFKQVLEDISRKPHEYFPVVDRHHMLKGIISLRDIKTVLFEADIYDLLVAADFCTREDLLTVSPDDSITNALEIMGDVDIGDLPVVTNTADGMKLEGLLRKADILAAYNKKIIDIMKDN